MHQSHPEFRALNSLLPQGKLIVEDEPNPVRILLLNLLFRDECLSRVISSVLRYHNIERLQASLLLSQSPAECRSRRSQYQSLDVRLSVDALVSRSVLMFAEELLMNIRKDMLNSISQKGDSDKGLPNKQHKLTSAQMQRKAAAAMLLQCGKRFLGLPTSVTDGQTNDDTLMRIIYLLRALSDVRFFAEFDSLDDCIERLLGKSIGSEASVQDSGEVRRVQSNEVLERKKLKKKKDKKEKKVAKEKKNKKGETDRAKVTDKSERRKSMNLSSKRQSADSTRVHNKDKVQVERRTLDENDLDERSNSASSNPRYSWATLHHHIRSSYEKLITSAFHEAVDSSSESDTDGGQGKGEQGRDIAREIEEGIITSVRDMLVKLQSLSTLHSVRLIAGDDVLLLRCEGMDIFQVLPSVAEIEAIENNAKAAARAKSKKDREKRREERKKSGKGEKKQKKKKQEKNEPSVAAENRQLANQTKSTSLVASPPRPALPPKREKLTIKLIVLGDCG